MNLGTHVLYRGNCRREDEIDNEGWSKGIICDITASGKFFKIFGTKRVIKAGLNKNGTWRSLGKPIIIDETPTSFQEGRLAWQSYLDECAADRIKDSKRRSIQYKINQLKRELEKLKNENT